MPQWGMFKKLSRANTEGRLKAFILVSGLLILAVLGLAGALRFTTIPQFCSKCHVMAPEYYTWKASSHLQITCNRCHIEPGFGNLVIQQLSAFKEVTLYFTGTYDRPIKMSNKIKDEICTQCHSNNRGITPSGDLIIPHDKHAAKKVLCVECHSGVAHGNIVARKMTDDGNYQVWSQEYGQEQMAATFAEPKMNTCLECHIKRNVTQKCEACHTTISLPPDHKVKDWDITHGHKAKLDLEYCNKCHSYSVEAKDVPVKDAVARYARGNVFCYECHQKRPAGHSEDWNIIHKQDAVNGDEAGCLVCHDYDQAGPQAKAVPTFCGKCHGKTNGQQDSGTKQPTATDNPGQTNGSGTEMGEEPFGQPGKTTMGKIHPLKWRTVHPSIIKEQGATNSGCWDCHATTHCSKCHLNQLNK